MSEQREIEVSVVSSPETSQCSSAMGSPGPSPHHHISTTTTSATGPLSFHPISRTSSPHPVSPGRKSPPSAGSPGTGAQAKTSSPLYTSFSISSILSRAEPAKKLNASVGPLQQSPPAQHPSVVEAAAAALHPCADTAMLSRRNPQTIRENTRILLEASKEISLEVNPEKTKYMIMSRDQNIVRNGNIQIGNLSFEEVEKFKYLGATVINVNDTREEIKHRINMGNAYYYSVEKLLSSSLFSKNLKVRIYKTVILPIVLYGCETWTLTLREEHRLRVFENKVLRKIFGAKRDEVTGEWRKLHTTELHALYSSSDIIRNIKSRRLRRVGHVARMDESRNAYSVLAGRPEGKKTFREAET
ncbi:hypothetical protein ANN_02170 [Periplaneta americana]|uniref:Endonuclease-reverse transcriptase n=1 Tax=Periplaneta americana TaxID=6978 RepID=A0ABQ8TYM2_PERAM|nr:hypothetical protein ANN_02170 [Periplaneta americana]